MLNILAGVMSIVIIFAEAVCAITLFDSMLIRKNICHNKNVQSIIEIAALTVTSICLVRISTNRFLECISILLLYILFTICFYKASFIMRLGIAVIFYTTLNAVDYVTYFGIRNFLSLPYDKVLDDPLRFFIAATISKTSLLLIIVVCGKFMKRGFSFEYISKYYWIIYIIQSVIIMVALLAINDLSTYIIHLPLSAITASMGLLLLDIAVYWLLELSARTGKNMRENALIKQQIELELNNIKSLSQAFDLQRQFIHDYKHTLGVVYQLLGTEKYEEALNYVKSISKELNYTTYRIKTGHNIIDALINQKDLQAKRNGVVLDIRAGNLSGINIPDNLLVIILANVLENAIEACSQLKDNKVVKVKLMDENGILVFSVINPVFGPVKIVNNMVRTTKDDKTYHGIGLKNVAMALSQCNGDYEIFCDGHNFQFTALIRLGS